MNRTSEAALPHGRYYYGWNIVAVTVLSQVAANGLTYNAFSLFVHDWSTQLRAPISELQLAVAAMALMAALSAPLIGSLADKYPARKLFGSGLIGVSIFFFAVSMATHAWQIIAMYGLLVPVALGLSTSITANPLISRWYNRRLGLALGLSSFGVGMAGVLFPPVIAVLLPEFGWRALWRGAGLIVALIITPVVVLVIRDRPSEREGLHYVAIDADKEGPPAAHGVQDGGGQLDWREVVGRKNFWLLILIYLPLMATYGGLAQNLAPFALSHGYAQQTAGQLLGALSFAHMAGNLVLGLLNDRYGYRRPLTGLALVVAAGAVVLAFGSGIFSIALGCILVGFGGAVFTLLAAAMASEFGAPGVGRAFGMVMFFIPVGTLAPVVVAKVQESTGSYLPGLLGLGTLAGLSGLVSLLLRAPALTQRRAA